MPSLTVAQLKVVAVLLQPAGSALNPEVTDRALAGLPSSVAKVTVTGVLVPVTTASGARAGRPGDGVVRWSLDRGWSSEPVFAWSALFLYV